jgi:hypothetical protein
MALIRFHVTILIATNNQCAQIVNAGYAQRAFIEVKRTDGSPITSATFEGQGVRVAMKDVFNNRPYWSFGPFTFTATVHVTISANSGGGFRPSKMVGPLTVSWSLLIAMRTTSSLSC